MSNYSTTPEHHTWTHNPLVQQLREENQRLRALLVETLDFLNPRAYTDHEDIDQRIRVELYKQAALKTERR